MKGFDEITVCPHCGAPTKESRTLEMTFCSDGCGCLEGELGLPTKFACLDCGDLCDEEQCKCGNGIQIKITYIGYGQWQAMEKGGSEDAEVVDGDWRYCGSPRGLGSTIQDAIDNLMETLCEKRAANADPTDDSFVYELKYQWS